MGNKTIISKIKYLYKKQRYRSIDRKHPPPEYSREEFLNFCLNSKKFQTIYKNWVESNYITDLAPSIDRLDDYKGYSFDNIQVVTWEENYKNYRNSVKNRINLKKLKPIQKICLKTGKVIEEYLCAKDAEIFYPYPDKSHICKCCKNKQKSHKGYGWRYK